MRAGAGLSGSLRDARRGARGFPTGDVLLVSRTRQENWRLPDEEVSEEEKQGSGVQVLRTHQHRRRTLVVPQKRITWGKRITLAGFAHELRKLRNYVHPGVWAPEKPTSMRFTKRVYGVAYEIFDVANSWLEHRVHGSLRRRMRQEGML